MPELPEVAVLARDLALNLKGKCLQSVRWHGEPRFLNKIIPLDVRNALRSMRGKQLAVTSRGKSLIVSTGTARIAIHLGMTGQFQSAKVPRKYSRHHFASLVWPGYSCHFLDFRRFARMRLEPRASKLALGGFEYPGFQLIGKKNLKALLNDGLHNFKRIPRITWLLGHGRSTGVGNYLANESLGRLRLSPFKPCKSAEEALVILQTCQAIAKASYLKGGTSFGIGYFQLNGVRGTFARKLKHYGNPDLKRLVFRGRPVYTTHDLVG